MGHDRDKRTHPKTPRLVLVLQASALSGLTQVEILVVPHSVVLMVSLVPVHAGGAQGGGASDRDVGAMKELAAAAATVKRRVKD